MGVKYIVQGAICKCMFGTAPDNIKVNTQSRLYLNDKNGSKKLAVTTTDIGPTFEKGTFGSCAKQNNKPCMALVSKWSGEEKHSVKGAGKMLTEESKATCPIGGTDCISVVYHGQQAEVSSQNTDNADSEVHSQINPFVDIKNQIKDKYPVIKLNWE